MKHSRWRADCARYSILILCHSPIFMLDIRCIYLFVFFLTFSYFRKENCDHISSETLDRIRKKLFWSKLHIPKLYPSGICGRRMEEGVSNRGNNKPQNILWTWVGEGN